MKNIFKNILIKTKKKIRSKMYLVPIVLLLSALASSFFEYNFILLGNIVGCSILTNIAFMGIFTFGNYCIFTKLSPVGLLLINVVDILGIIIERFAYVKIFTMFIAIIISTLSIVLFIEKKIKKR